MDGDDDAIRQPNFGCRYVLDELAQNGRFAEEGLAIGEDPARLVPAARQREDVADLARRQGVLDKARDKNRDGCGDPRLT